MNIAISAVKPELSADLLSDTQPLYERVKRVIPPFEWPIHAPLVHEINQLKRDRNAVILAHNYMTPEIYHCVSDIVGDSLALARQAAATDSKVIVLAGVHFMAETAKLLNPGKIVLMPDLAAGCSLASSITGADVRDLRAKYPGVPVVAYVNTSAEVKAESDICCTSGNAVEVVESLGVKRAIFLPDQYLAKYVASLTQVEIIPWPGQCEVHERFTATEIQTYASSHDGLIVLAHPECTPDVLSVADYVGSTARMIEFVRREQPTKVMLVTECSMSDNVAVEFPNIEFVRPCNLCQYMKRITLTNIRDSLISLQPRIEIDPAIAARARQAVERMIAIGK
ncbi:MAG: quinolinate synthase NadA [Rhodospirillaceae bacterium]